MKKWFINWFKTRILKQVVFERDGHTPVDCKGLQLVLGEPLKEGAKYRISSEWSEWDYIGEGKYMRKSGISLTTDTKNPYFMVSIRKAKEKFFNERI